MTSTANPFFDERPVVIVGAGAAGLCAALFASYGSHPVVLLEGTTRPGQKILISGGGRCNVLPELAAPTDFISDASPHTVRKILNAWPLAEVRRFFEDDLGVSLRVEPETGKLFPVANRARVVLDALLNRATIAGVKLNLGARAVRLERDETWSVILDSGEAIQAEAVVLATGGLSVPATGSDGRGLHMAQELGHTVVPTYPALVPLTSEVAAHHALAGLSLPVTLTSHVPDGKRKFQTQGGFLFTHRGYSGPAVLNIAHLAVRSTFLGGPRPPIYVQWSALDAAAWDALLQRGRAPLQTLLREHLPERLATQLLSETRITGTEPSQLTRDSRRQLVEALTHYPLPWHGHEGYRTAEVTGGGVTLEEVNSATLESRLAPGLYLCGEILDAFGPIGGYNFLWAWVTGRLAGLSAGKMP